MSRVDRITHQDWQPALGADDIVGGLDDIDQCIRIILGTPLGSDPLRPDFGSNVHRYIDWPQDRAVTYLVREVFQAVCRWEKRVGQMDVRVSHEVAAVVITVIWRPASGGSENTTALRFDQ